MKSGRRLHPAASASRSIASPSRGSNVISLSRFVSSVLRSRSTSAVACLGDHPPRAVRTSWQSSTLEPSMLASRRSRLPKSRWARTSSSTPSTKITARSSVVCQPRRAASSSASRACSIPPSDTRSRAAHRTAWRPAALTRLACAASSVLFPRPELATRTRCRRSPSSRSSFHVSGDFSPRSIRRVAGGRGSVPRSRKWRTMSMYGMSVHLRAARWMRCAGTSSCLALARPDSAGPSVPRADRAGHRLMEPQTGGQANPPRGANLLHARVVLDVLPYPLHVGSMLGVWSSPV